MSKKKYSPLTPEQLVAQHKARVAKRQELPEAEQFSAAENRQNRDLITFSEQDSEDYKKKFNTDEVDPREIQLSHQQRADIDWTLNRIPRNQAEVREKKKALLVDKAIKDNQRKKEAARPILAKDVEEEYGPEIAQDYEKILKEKNEIAGKTTGTDVTIAGSALKTSPSLTTRWAGGVLESIGQMLPESWGLSEEEEKKFKKLDDDAFKIDSPIAEKKLKEAQERKQVLEEMYEPYKNGEGDGMWQRRVLKTAIEIQDRDIRNHTEYLTRGGFWSKFNNHFLNIGSGGAVNAIETIGVVLPVANKAQENPESLTNAEKELLKSFAAEQESMGTYSERAGWRTRAGDGLGHSASFLTGLAITRGVGGAAKNAVTKGLTKAAGKMATKVAGSAITKGAIATTGAAADVLAQSSVMPGTYDQYAKNRIGIVEYDTENDKVMLNEQIYENFKQELSGQRAKAQGIFNQLNAKAMDNGGNLSESENKAYQDARARLGYESTSDLESFDEIEARTKKMYPERMGVANAFRHAIGATASEIIAEKYIGLGLNKLGGRLFGPKFANTKFGRTYRRIEDKFSKQLNKTPLSGTIQGLPEEFMEEVLVSPLHAINDWSADPLKEWWSPEEGFNTKTALDVGIQTLIMGGGFRAAGGVGELAGYLTNKEAFKKNRKARKEALKTFRNIRYANSNDELNGFIDLMSGQDVSSVQSTMSVIEGLRAQNTAEDDKKADEMEKKMFTNLLQTSLDTGTFNEFKDAMEKVVTNPDISDKTKRNAFNLKDILDNLSKKKEQYSGLLNSDVLMGRELMKELTKKDLANLDTAIQTNEQSAREEWQELQDRHPELNELSFEELTGENLDPERRKEIEGMDQRVVDLAKKYNFQDITNHMGLHGAKKLAKEFLGSQMEANRQESSPEHQRVLKGRIQLAKQFEKYLQEELSDNIAEIDDSQIELAMKLAEGELKKKGLSFTQREKDNITANARRIARRKELERQIQEANEVVEEEKNNQQSSAPEQNQQPTPQQAPPESPELPSSLVIPEEEREELRRNANNGAAAMGEAANEHIREEPDLFGASQNPPESAFYEGPNRGNEGGPVNLDDIDELPGNELSPAMTEKAKQIVKDFYEGFEKAFGRKPSFTEMMEQLIEYNGPETMQNLFIGYAAGWDANGYAQTDFDDVYDHFYKPLQRLARTNMNDMASLLEEEKKENEEIREEQEEEQDRLESEPDDPVINDEDNRPVRKKRPKHGGHKIGTAESKMGFNAIEYRTITDETGQTRKVSVNTNKLKESDILDFRELLHPDKYKSGDTAGITVVPDEGDNWDKIQVLVGYDENNEPLTESFRAWVARKEKDNPDFRNTQEFRDKVPMVIVGSEGQAVAFVHDTDWYNGVNVRAKGDSDYEPGNIPVESTTGKLINEGKENVRNIRNKVIQEGATEIVVKEKYTGPYNQIEDGEPLISVEESNPQSIMAVQHGESLSTALGQQFEDGTRILLNDPETFRMPARNPVVGGKKFEHDGKLYAVMRVGTAINDEGVEVETWRAFRVNRTMDNNVDNGIKSDALETLKWLWAAQSRLKTPNDYKKVISGTKYELTQEEAIKIQEEVFEITGADITDGRAVTTLMKLFGTIRGGSTLSLYKEHLFGDPEKDIEAKPASWFAQHTDLTYLGENRDMLMIDGNKEVRNIGPYENMVKKQTSTNIRGINVGTAEDPVYQIHPQPVITFGIKEDSDPGNKVTLKLKPMAPPTQNNSPSPIGTGNTESTSTESSSNESSNQEESKEKDAEKISEFVNKVKDFFRTELQIKYDNNLGTNNDVDELPGDLTSTENLQNVLDITENLTIKQEGQIVEFLFNHLLTSIAAKYKTRLSKEELLKELENSFSDLTEAYLEETENIVSELEKIVAAYPDNQEAKVALANAKKAITLYDSIYDNWPNIEQKAIDKVTKYTEIREVDEDDRQQETDTTERKENWNASSLEEGAKDKTSYQLKRFMAGIPQLTHEKDADGNFKQKRGFLGTPLFMSFDDVYNSISQFYAGNTDIPSDYNEMVDILKGMQGRVPWVQAFVEKLEAADDQLKNQFVTTYTRHSLSMKFAMYSKDRETGGVNLMAYDTNAHEISRVIIDKWKNNMKMGSLINEGKIDKEAAKKLYNKYHSWGMNKHLVPDEDVRDFLSEFGIELSNEAWDELKAGRFYNTKMISYQGLFMDQSGLFKVLDDTLTEMMNMEDENIDMEQSPEHHPYTNMSNVLKSIAKIEANYTVNGITLTFRDGGKLISSQVPPKFATDRISDIKRSAKQNGKGIIDDLLSLPISSQNTFLQLLKNNPSFREKFGVSHLGLQAFKELGKKSNPNFTSITDLNDIDHDHVKMTFLQDDTQGELKTAGMPMRIGRMFFPTMSDKDQMLLLTTGIYDFAKHPDQLFKGDRTIDKPEFSLGAKKLLYDKLVKAELERIIDFQVNVGETNIKGYDEAAQTFNFIPELNNVKNDKGMRAIHKIKILAKEGMEADEILKRIEDENKKGFAYVVEQFIHSEAATKKEEWDGSIITIGDNGISKLGFNKRYLDRMGKMTLAEKANVGVYEYVINSVLANHDMYTGIAGDPALFAKDSDFKGKPTEQSDEFYSNVMEKNGVNIGKRLALLIAPGTKLANSKDEKYIQLFLKDTNDVSENMEYLIKLFHGDKALSDEVVEDLGILRSNIPDEQKKPVRKRMEERFPDLADYMNIESTDAQEYTTLAEHVHIMNKQGRLSPDQYSQLQEIIKTGGEVPKELLGIVMQPIKPVYTGQIFGHGNVARTMYIKSSSFPLIKELTAGTQLDALRRKMEEIEKKHGGTRKVRASYQTANKVGAVKNPIDITDQHSLDNAEDASLVLNRDNFRIQQDVPYKSDKKGVDTISMGTQIFKLLMGDGMVDEEGFVLDGQEMNGKELRDEFNSVFGALVRNKKNDLYNELGLDKDGRPVDPKATAQRLQELLKNEAIKRNYPLQDIKNLEIEEKHHNGNTYYEFITPLWLSTNSIRFESMLNAIVTNRLMKHKIPGFSAVAASEHGMRRIKYSENMDDLSESVKSRVIYLDGWNGRELEGVQEKDVDGTMRFTRAQVFATSKFKGADGKLVDLFEDFDKETGKGKYLFTNKEGVLTLRKSMFDQEILNMFSFRTPTSSHVSASTIEVVGILPPESGDLMMVPKNFTKQKGLDYDVDKEYTYMLNHVIDPKTGKIEVLTEKHKKRHLAKYERHLKEGAAPANLSEEEASELKESLIATGMPEEEADSFVYSNRRTQEKIDRVTKEYDKKLLENRFIKIHLSVYNNPAQGVQKRINKVLSMDFAKQQADIIDNLSNQRVDKTNFSILSDSYQRKKMALGAAGKLAIGVYSNFVTAHGLAQQVNEPMYMTNAKGDPKTMVLGNLRTDRAKMPNAYGNVMTLDGDRTTAEAFAEKQNTATDNEKEQVLGRVNVNGLTINVDAYMTLLGFDKVNVTVPKGEGSETIKMSAPYLLLSQPIMKDYVKMMQDGRGTTAEFDSDLEQKVINKLINKYYGQGGLSIDMKTGHISGNRYWNDKLTGQAMYNGIKNPVESTAQGEIQIAALSAFLQFNIDAKKFASTVGLVNTNDLGISMIEAGHLQKQLEHFAEPNNPYIPGSASIANATSLIGEFAYSIPEGEDADQWVKIGRRYIKPTTAQGNIVVHGIQAGTELWKDYFPYMDPAFTDVISQIQQVAEIDLEKQHKVNEENQQIVSDVKKYFYSIKSNGLFNQRASEERKRLFIDNENQESLAVYLMNALKNSDQGAETLKNNRLIRKFNFEPRYDGRPSLIKFNNVDKSTFDEDYLYNALTELILDDVPLPPFNGQEYSTKKLAQDLITYAYVEGGTQQAIQFVKYVPIEYLQDVKIPVVRDAKGNVEMVSVNQVMQSYNANRNPDRFRTLFGFSNEVSEMDSADELMNFTVQYFQHHPEKLSQVTLKDKNVSPIRKGNQVVGFDLLPTEGQAAPLMLSVKVSTKSKKRQDKWQVYKSVGGGRYQRIDVLGDHGMNEYEFRKPGNTTPAKTLIGPAPSFKAQKQLAKRTQAKPTLPFDIEEGDTIATALEKLTRGDMKEYAHIRQMAEFLMPFADHKTTLRIDHTGMRQKGVYTSNVNDDRISEITMNGAYLGHDSDTSAKIFFHEFVHSITRRELNKWYEKDGVTFKKGPDGQDMMPPLHIQRLNMVFREFRKGYEKDLPAFQEKLAKIKSGTSMNSLNNYEENELYAASSIFEFVSVMMTEPSLQEKMMQVPYKKSKDSILKRFGRAIADLINAIRPNSSGETTITEESIASIIGVIREHDKRINREKKQNVIGGGTPPNFTEEIGGSGIPSQPYLDESFGQAGRPPQAPIESYQEDFEVGGQRLLFNEPQDTPPQSDTDNTIGGGEPPIVEGGQDTTEENDRDYMLNYNMNEIYNNTPELKEIGSAQDYAAYLDSDFPESDAVRGLKKDIKGFKEFMKSLTFTNEELDNLPECI